MADAFMTSETNPTLPDPADEAGAAGAPTAAAAEDQGDDFSILDLDAALSSTDTAPSDRRGPMARMREGRLPALDLIVLVTAEAALPRALLHDLARGRPVAAVITVPSTAWLRPLTHLIDRLSRHCACVVETSVRSKTRPSGAESEALQALSNGRPVVAIGTNPEALSPLITAAADHRAALPPPDAEIMGEVIRRWHPRAPRITLTAESLAGLDLPDLAAALRPRSTPAACRARLVRASRARLGPQAGSPVPPLASLAITGPALGWARGLVADIARVRAGALSASALEGAVFYGPPGTGKTLLARAIAAEAGVPFFATSVGNWFSTSNGYLDGVIKEIDAFCDGLLQAANSHTTAIGFADELDGLPDRVGLSQSRSWWTPVVAHVLLRFQALREAGVVLLAATNHLDQVDAALLRPGRLDRSFWIGPPDEAGRAAILRGHLVPDLAGVDLTAAARLAGSATGAELAGHVKAARAMARAAERPLSLDDLLTVIAPPDRRPLDQQQRVALHEAAHAVISHRLGLPVIEVTTRERGLSAGRTVLGEGDPMPDRDALERRVVGWLAGRAADLALGAGAHAGAQADLRAATRLCCAIEVSFGLGTRLLYRADPETCDHLLRSDPGLAAQTEARMGRLLAWASDLVVADRKAIEAVAAALLRQRCLSGTEVAALAAEHPPTARHDRHHRPSVRARSKARPHAVGSTV